MDNDLVPSNKPSAIIHPRTVRYPPATNHQSLLYSTSCFSFISVCYSASFFYVLKRHLTKKKLKTRSALDSFGPLISFKGHSSSPPFTDRTDANRFKKLFINAINLSRSALSVEKKRGEREDGINYAEPLKLRKRFKNARNRKMPLTNDECAPPTLLKQLSPK